MKEWAEYAVVRVLLKILEVLPRPTARPLAASAAHVLFLLSPRLRKTAEFNLHLAFPDWTERQRAEVIRTMTRNLGWMAAEFARLRKYVKQNIEDVVILDGHKIFLQGHQQGKGILYLTGHIGAWELSSFAHALYGYPLHYMARPLDNRRLDQLVNRYRALSGNRPIFKNESARTIRKVLKDAGTVGILADQNTMPEEGVFVNFLGTPACTTTGLTRVALHTGAAVVPGYVYWDPQIKKYHLRFEPPVELSRTGNIDRDILESTPKFTKVLEEIIRTYPDQWVWLHGRWNTRPPGESPLYTLN
jgi:KDO2-lipid IV(A) lauroyltransferase